MANSIKIAHRGVWPNPSINAVLSWWGLPGKSTDGAERGRSSGCCSWMPGGLRFSALPGSRLSLEGRGEWHAARPPGRGAVSRLIWEYPGGCVQLWPEVGWDLFRREHLRDPWRLRKEKKGVWNSQNRDSPSKVAKVGLSLTWAANTKFSVPGA